MTAARAPLNGVATEGPGLSCVPYSAAPLPDETIPDSARSAWASSFPSADLVGLAVSQFAEHFAHAVDAALAEDDNRSRRLGFHVGVAPGAVSIRTFDLVGLRVAGGPSARGAVTEWSRKSRAAMVRRLAELDWSFVTGDPGRIPAMGTLTYPYEWLAFAPTGEHLKAHFEALLKRYERAWGHKLRCVWKMEFQRRGAPHFHFYFVPPRGSVEVVHEGKEESVEFRRWLSLTWASIISADRAGIIERFSYSACMRKHGCPASWRAEGSLWEEYFEPCYGCAQDVDPFAEMIYEDEVRKSLAAGTNVDFSEGMRSSDPKRLAIYFAKRTAIHNGKSSGTKEYQHRVPDAWLMVPGEGPGRFWGARGIATVRTEMTISPEDYLVLRRTLRRWQHAQQRTTTRTVERTNQTTGAVTKRHLRRRYQPGISGGGIKGGWVLVNNGPAFAEQLARWVASSAAADD